MSQSRFPRSERCWEAEFSVRFINKTYKVVNVIWLDFDGRERVYAVLKPAECVSMASYTTYPWISKDQVTKRRLLLNKELVFCETEVPASGVTEAVITYPELPLHPLHDLCLDKIFSCVRRKEDVKSLQLPLPLQTMLEGWFDVKI